MDTEGVSNQQPAANCPLCALGRTTVAAIADDMGLTNEHVAAAFAHLRRHATWLLADAFVLIIRKFALPRLEERVPVLGPASRTGVEAYLKTRGLRAMGSGE